MKKYLIVLLILIVAFFGYKAFRNVSPNQQEAGTISAPSANPPTSRTTTNDSTPSPTSPGSSPGTISTSPNNNTSTTSPNTISPSTNNPPPTTNPYNPPPSTAPVTPSPQLISRTQYPYSLLNKSSDVVVIQKFLIEKGYLVGRADGRYGNMTRKAVMSYQRANGINPTGNVGPITMEAINTTILGGKVGVN